MEAIIIFSAEDFKKLNHPPIFFSSHELLTEDIGKINLTFDLDGLCKSFSIPYAMRHNTLQFYLDSPSWINEFFIIKTSQYLHQFIETVRNSDEWRLYFLLNANEIIFGDTLLSDLKKYENFQAENFTYQNQIKLIRLYERATQCSNELYQNLSSKHLFLGLEGERLTTFYQSCGYGKATQEADGIFCFKFNDFSTNKNFSLFMQIELENLGYFCFIGLENNPGLSM